jgi:hypothetical protein
MNTYRKLTICLVGAAMTVGMLSAQAEALDEKLTVTFSAPVATPVDVLPAGTYVFESLDGGSVTRILSGDQRRVYATLLTVPMERKTAEEKAIILGPGLNGGPQRIESWFYPGDSRGCEFIYRSEHPHKGPGAFSRGAKDIVMAPEFVAVHAAHAGAHLGSALVHAGKHLVS